MRSLLLDQPDVHKQHNKISISLSLCRTMVYLIIQLVLYFLLGSRALLTDMHMLISYLIFYAAEPCIITHLIIQLVLYFLLGSRALLSYICIYLIISQSNQLPNHIISHISQFIYFGSLSLCKITLAISQITILFNISTFGIIAQTTPTLYIDFS